jgi:hypothetical protein
VGCGKKKRKRILSPRRQDAKEEEKIRNPKTKKSFPDLLGVLASWREIFPAPLPLRSDLSSASHHPPPTRRTPDEVCVSVSVFLA